MRYDLIGFLPRSEDIRAVVIDSIHTRKILQDEQRVSKEQAPSRLRVLERLSDGLEEASRDVEGLLFHHSNLFENVCIIGSQLPDVAQIDDGIVHPTFGKQPARSLFQEQAADEQKSCRDQLHREWDKPLLLA